MYKLILSTCLLALVSLHTSAAPQNYVSPFQRTYAVPSYVAVSHSPYQAVTAAPLVRGSVYQPGASAAIVRQQQDVGADGSYQYGYDTSNGISVQESAQIRAVGPEQSIKSAQGSYSYTSPDGVPITVTYTADENGFQAYGAHLPTPPPIPEAIQRALDYIAAHPERQEQPYQYNQYNQYKQRY